MSWYAGRQSSAGKTNYQTDFLLCPKERETKKSPAGSCHCNMIQNCALKAEIFWIICLGLVLLCNRWGGAEVIVTEIVRLVDAPPSSTWPPAPACPACCSWPTPLQSFNFHGLATTTTTSTTDQDQFPKGQRAGARKVHDQMLISPNRHAIVRGRVRSIHRHISWNVFILNL